MKRKIKPIDQEINLFRCEKANEYYHGDLCGCCHTNPRKRGDWLCSQCRNDQRDWQRSELDENTQHIISIREDDT